MAIPTISDVAGVTAEPEMKFMNDGKALLKIRLAFNDSKYDEQQGKWVTAKTFYVDGAIWEQAAERTVAWLRKGDQVYVTGRLETQSWEKDGQKQSKPALTVKSIRKLAPAEKSQGNGQQNQQNSAGQYQNTGQSGWGNTQNTQTGNNSPGGWGNEQQAGPPF